MRVLVEQTQKVIAGWLEDLRLTDAVGLHLLLGGVDATPWPWALHPERPAILVGTQDMLLSRALNRGFASYRPRWPVEFGLLNIDALWVVDEVQLMDVGLATSAQLAALRQQLSPKQLRPTHTWWMSATLQPSWLGTIDLEAGLPALEAEAIRIAPKERKGGLWAVEKELDLEPSTTTDEQIANAVVHRHAPGTLTLVICNRVDRARDIRAALNAALVPAQKGKKKAEPARPVPELRLIHSQFRGAQRAEWANTFLSKKAEIPPAGRIIVSTQIVEAGVDISARLLVTELAPWPSLVQRFGRLARYEKEEGTAVVVGAAPDTEKKAAPYDMESCAAAAEALDRIKRGSKDVSPRSLEQFEESLEKAEDPLLRRLYPYEPAQVLREQDVRELFDTTPDLTGADIDVSPFIREGDERDVQVFWRSISPKQRTHDRAQIGKVERSELCPVKIGVIREWLKAPHIAYRLDYVAGEWSRVEPRQIIPGNVLLIPSELGGYDGQVGWTSSSNAFVEPIPPPEKVDSAEEKLASASEAQEDDSLSHFKWKSIAFHGEEAGTIATEIAQRLELPTATLRLLELTGRWHDAGKAHPVFQGRITDEARKSGGPLAQRRELAKAPDNAWSRRPSDRPGFRHELASTLAMFELLRRRNPDHGALAGGVRELLDAIGTITPPMTDDERIPGSHRLAGELVGLAPGDFDLVAWLVCAHHGKVRCNWTSTPADQEDASGAIFGVMRDDRLPELTLATASRGREGLPALSLSLECAGLGINPRYGRSWRDRVAGLLETYGPFALAYLEAVFRAADGRASQLDTEEPG